MSLILLDFALVNIVFRHIFVLQNEIFPSWKSYINQSMPLLLLYKLCIFRVYCEDRGKEHLPIHIPESAACDGASDCFDQSDEMNCSSDTHFYCDSGVVKFVPSSKVSLKMMDFNTVFVI